MNRPCSVFTADVTSTLRALTPGSPTQTSRRRVWCAWSWSARSSLCIAGTDAGPIIHEVLSELPVDVVAQSPVACGEGIVYLAASKMATHGGSLALKLARRSEDGSASHRTIVPTIPLYVAGWPVDVFC